MTSPRSKLKRNTIDQTEYLLRDRKYKKYKAIEVVGRNKKKNEESESEYSSDITEDELEDDFDEPDRVNRLYPELEPVSSNKSPYSSSGSLYRPSNRKGRWSEKSEPKPANSPKKLYPDLPNNLNSENSSFNYKMIFGVLLLIFIGGSFFVYSSPKEKEIRTLEEIYQVIKPGLISLKEKYPQSKQLWTQVLWQIQHITSDSPEQPATLFFVVPEGAEVSANCFIKRLCEAVANGFQDDEIVMFDAATSSDLDPDDFKSELDKSLSGLSNVHCAIVHNLEVAVAGAVMLLHGYCDNENAIFKRALLIFTIRSNAAYEVRSLPQIFELIEENLKAAWGLDMRTDDIAALISRIASSPVLFKPEGSSC